jgi:predicted phosphoribosyltransferase
MARKRFQDRAEAGHKLAERLRDSPYGEEDPVVLAVAPEGVPVAKEVAAALGAPLDVFLVRRLPVPGNEDVAWFGAIARGAAHVIYDEVVRGAGISDDDREAIEARERKELERLEGEIRGDRHAADIVGRTAVLVDDGLGSGLTMLTAISAARADGPAQIVVAVPIAPPDVREVLSQRADDVVCLHAPADFDSVGNWYEDFSTLSVENVRGLLASARAPGAAAGSERAAG